MKLTKSQRLKDIELQITIIELGNVLRQKAKQHNKSVAQGERKSLQTKELFNGHDHRDSVDFNTNLN